MGMDDYSVARGLMPRTPGGNHTGWASRDYAPFIPCKVSICPCNKNDKCELPGNISINADGRCQSGIDFMTDYQKKLEKYTKNKRSEASRSKTGSGTLA